MLRLTELRLPLNHTEEELRAAILRELGIEPRELVSYSIFRRSFDARKRGAIALIYHLDVETAREGEILRRLRGNPHVGPTPDTSYRLVAQAPPDLATRPVVIGTGPCGLFAGLLLAQMGFRPIILERGKQVRERTVDTFGLWRKGMLNPESNVQFGEGGAGTFSDGKLYSQIKDPGHRGRKVLTEFVEAGAPAEILYRQQAPHRHLPAGQDGGGHAREDRVAGRRDPLREPGRGPRHRTTGKVRGVMLADGSASAADHVVLAVGHSARDTFEMLLRRGVYIEPKPFSIGLRIEHPQTLDRPLPLRPAGRASAARRRRLQAGPPLPQRPLGLQLLHVPGGHGGGRGLGAGPGGHQRHEPVLRDERNANSGHRRRHHAGRLSRRRRWPASAFSATGRSARSSWAAAPTRRPASSSATSSRGGPSTEFGGVLPSYQPGVRLGDLSSSLPDYAIEAIREALPAFDQQMRGFAMRDAVLTGVETRTSSPIRIQREARTSRA